MAQASIRTTIGKFSLPKSVKHTVYAYTTWYKCPNVRQWSQKLVKRRSRSHVQNIHAFVKAWLVGEMNFLSESEIVKPELISKKLSN